MATGCAFALFTTLSELNVLADDMQDTIVASVADEVDEIIDEVDIHDTEQNYMDDSIKGVLEENA